MSGGCLSPASRIRIAADVHRHSTSDDDSGCVLEEYSWVPSGIKPDTVHMYFSCLPDDKIPYVNSVGEEWRLRQLQYQLPAQDSDPRYCLKLSAEEQHELIQFEIGRKRECLGRGTIEQLPYDNKRRHCHQCKGSLCEGNLVVCAERLGIDVHWHPQCFICTECSNLLVDLIYFKHGADVFCGRHHAEQIKPRCAKCDELIFSEECTEAEGRTWHMTHFACDECDVQLGGQRYIVKSERILCIPCYHRIYSLICNTCHKEIVVDKPHITQSDIHWHADERCFSCCECAKNLLGKRYSFKNDRLFCGVNKCSEKRSPKVTFNGKVTYDSDNHSAPLPPPRNPPPSPPIENIYETVLPCSSKDADEIDHVRRSSRRSLSADVRRCPTDQIRKISKNGSEIEIKRQNYYSKMPPTSQSQRRKHQRCSSCSSSESESDDVYLSNYLAASLWPKIQLTICCSVKASNSVELPESRQKRRPNKMSTEQTDTFKCCRIMPVLTDEHKMQLNDPDGGMLLQVNYRKPSAKREFRLKFPNSDVLYIDPVIFSRHSDTFKKFFDDYPDANEMEITEFESTEMERVICAVCPTVYEHFPIPPTVYDIDYILPVACQMEMRDLTNACVAVLKNDTHTDLFPFCAFIELFDVAYRCELDSTIQANILWKILRHSIPCSDAQLLQKGITSKLMRFFIWEWTNSVVWQEKNGTRSRNWRWKMPSSCNVTQRKIFDLLSSPVIRFAHLGVRYFDIPHSHRRCDECMNPMRQSRRTPGAIICLQCSGTFCATCAKTVCQAKLNYFLDEVHQLEEHQVIDAALRRLINANIKSNIPLFGRVIRKLLPELNIRMRKRQNFIPKNYEKLYGIW